MENYSQQVYHHSAFLQCFFCLAASTVWESVRRRIHAREIQRYREHRAIY